MRLRRPCDLYAALAALRLASRLARLVAALRSTRLRRLLRRSLAPALAFALAAAPLAAQVPGEEQQVSPPDAFGTRPAVAMDDQGEFVVAWVEASGPVYIRRYGADGGPLGDATPISGEVTIGDSRPAIAMDDQGAFVVAWEEQASSDSEGGIFVRRFGEGGQPLAEAVRVNPSTFGIHSDPSVAMDDDGAFVVAWESSSFSGSGDDSINFRRFSAGGEPIDTLARFVASADVSSPDVALDADGDIVVVWEQSDDILGARFLATSAQPESVFGSAASGSQLFNYPGVALDADGEFVVAWNDTFFDSVRAQRYTAGAVADGPELVVSTSFLTFGGETEAPRVAHLSGGPVVAWTGEGSNDIESDNEVVFRRFGPSAPIDADEQQVAEQFPRGSAYADVASSPGGSFVIVWQADVDVCDDGCFVPAVFARLYSPRNSYSVRSSTAGTNEGSGAPVIFTVARGSAAGESRVGYTLGGTAALGDDYTIRRAPAGVVTTTGTIRFEQGQRELEIELELVDDTRGEPTKTVVLSLRALSPFDRLVFPLSVVTLGDDDLSEVRIVQTGGSTVVAQGGPADTFTVALRTVPLHPVTITLTPTDRRLNLGMGFSAPLRLAFQPDASATAPQQVRVFTSGLEGEGAAPAANAGIRLEAHSADPAYDRGARFTVDGRDLGTLPVDLVVPPGENPNPLLPSHYLPLIQR